MEGRVQAVKDVEGRWQVDGRRGSGDRSTVSATDPLERSVDWAET